VWGKHYWFFLHTLARTYPDVPNSTTKRKYYDFISNISLFLPDDEMGNKFSRMIDAYPVSPYLDSRESFMRWMNFIHNKMNAHLGKQEMSFEESILRYESEYLPKPVYLYQQMRIRRKVLQLGFVFCLLVAIFLFMR